MTRAELHHLVDELPDQSMDASDEGWVAYQRSEAVKVV
jgi:hypothetical protein